MTKGHCLCGAVRWETGGSQKWAGCCHCESCRRNCAAPVTAFFGVADGRWKWTGDLPATYQASDHATRRFCARCGTPMGYRSTRFPDEVHFYAAGMDDPSQFRPTSHFHHDEALAWLHISDDLRRFA
jgi:hypothetical protein